MASDKNGDIMKAKPIEPFDKYKSWYKLDMDGAYITKYEVTPKKVPAETVQIKKEAKKKAKTPSVVQPQKSNQKQYNCAHEYSSRIVAHLKVLIILILSTLCGFSYFWPVRIPKRKPRHKEDR